MSNRFPRYAENLVKTLCSEYGVSCHEVEEDVTGWDLQVELPADDRTGPPDTHAGFWQTFVQVKSTYSKTAKCRIKLSNMVYAAQSINPWFIVLVQKDEIYNTEYFYVKHIWKPLIERTLEKARKAYEQNKALHKQHVNLTFYNSERCDENPISRMHHTIKSISPNYHKEKAIIYNTVGYEEGFMQGTITFQPKNKEELLDNFLGLGSGLPVASFTGYPKRFGIVSESPEVELHSGTAEITPFPVTTAEVRLIGQRSGSTISQEAAVYSTPFPGVHPSDQRIRFSTKFLELIYTFDGSGRVDVNWDAHTETSLNTLWQFCKFNRMLVSEAVDCEVWFKKRKALGAHIHLADTTYDLDWPSLNSVLDTLASCCTENELHEINICLAQVLHKNQYCMLFYTVSSPRTMLIEFDEKNGHNKEEETLENVRSALYYTYVELSEYIFCRILKRKILQNHVVGERRKVEMDTPIAVRSYVLLATDTNALDTLKSDYQRAVDSEDALNGNTLEIGDISCLING